MKNLLIALTALLIGLGIGYLLWGKDESNITDENYEKILGTNQVRNILTNIFKPTSEHKPTALPTADVIGQIEALYQNIKQDADFVKKTIKPSYVFDLSPLVDLALSQNIPIKDFGKLQMRLYPSSNKTRDSLSIIVGLELKGQVFKGDKQMFDYIGPCPRNCPDNDIYKLDEWDSKHYSKIGRNLVKERAEMK